MPAMANATGLSSHSISVASDHPGFLEIHSSANTATPTILAARESVSPRPMEHKFAKLFFSFFN
jgi:hypothetical protein